MQYVILLRGINVGGNNKVSVAALKGALEAGGFDEVKTYINSGNVLLKSSLSTEDVNAMVEKTIKQNFGFTINALTYPAAAFQKITSALPNDWTHDKTMGCNVLFLGPDIDSPDIMNELPARPGIDTLLYVPGAVFWAFDASNRSKTGISKLVGPGSYQQMTIRNCNTVRKVAALLDA